MNKIRFNLSIALVFILFSVILSCGDDGDISTDISGNISTKTKIKGCTNLHSFNYNSLAEEDDGSCKEMYGCLGYSSGGVNSGQFGTT